MRKKTELALKKVRSALKTAIDRFLRIVRFFYFYIPELLAFIVVLLFAVKFISDWGEDTTAITNAAFAITASLCALCFGFARSIGQDEDLKDRIVFSGERLFHAAILLIIGSILKYGLINISELTDGTEVWFGTVEFILGQATGITFVFAVLFAHSGIRMMHRVLVARTSRMKEWDHLV